MPSISSQSMHTAVYRDYDLCLYLNDAEGHAGRRGAAMLVGY